MEKIGQNEAYVLCSYSPDGRLYYLIVDNVFMFSCVNLQDAIIDLICFYYVLDISYPTMMNSLLIFIQHFIFSLLQVLCLHVSSIYVLNCNNFFLFIYQVQYKVL